MGVTGCAGSLYDLSAFLPCATAKAKAARGILLLPLNLGEGIAQGHLIYNSSEPVMFNSIRK